MAKYRIWSVIIVLAAIAVGWFVYSTEVGAEGGRFKFKLGLDLAGGSQLTYEADTSSIDPSEVEDAMSSLREVIERRVNAFGVSEPTVQVEQGGLIGADEDKQRLIVELPGVTDVEEAKAEIGRTPLLEFRLLDQSASVSSFSFSTTSETETESELASTSESTQISGDSFIETGLTGRFLERAQLQFDQFSGEPLVQIEFNQEGSDLFESITAEHTGEVLAIFLDGNLISNPVIREVISGGVATISGGFDPEEARELARDLNLGALPVPISLVQEQTVGPSLGKAAVSAGLEAGIIGFILVLIFLILWYRLPGLLAGIALASYVAMMLALFKLIPVTLTSAGIAGFILSIGMAVDANVLIFERLKEELTGKKSFLDCVKDAVKRAWLSIRDGNLSTLITAIILFYATTSLVRGFALVLGIGVLISMLTAIAITRTFLLAIVPAEGQGSEGLRFLMGSGIRKNKNESN